MLAANKGLMSAAGRQYSVFVVNSTNFIPLLSIVTNWVAPTRHYREEYFSKQMRYLGRFRTFWGLDIEGDVIMGKQRITDRRTISPL